MLFAEGSGAGLNCAATITHGTEEFANIGLVPGVNVPASVGIFRFGLGGPTAELVKGSAPGQVRLTLRLHRAETCGSSGECTVFSPGSFSVFPATSNWNEGQAQWCKASNTRNWDAPGVGGADRGVLAAQVALADVAGWTVAELSAGAVTSWVGSGASDRLSLLVLSQDGGKMVVDTREALAMGTDVAPQLIVEFCQ